MAASSSQSSRGSRIAVAGATGRVGSALTAVLAADDVEIVALTRNPDGARLSEGVGMAAVDFESPATLQAALRGADRLFLSQGTSPRQVANEIALIDAAVGAGIRHIVKLSSLGPATRLNPLAWHMQVEAHLSRQPVASTVLRPSAYADNLKRFGPQVATGTWAGAAGAGGRINFIDPRDIAAVARVALHSTVDPTSQRAWHLTGPRAWTMPEISAELARLLGHGVTYVERSSAEHRAALLAAGMSPFVADLLVGLDQMYRESSFGETTLSVQELTGNAPRSLESWLAENVSAFQSKPAS